MPFSLHIFFGSFLRDHFKLYPSPSLPQPVNIHVPVIRIEQITPLKICLYVVKRSEINWIIRNSDCADYKRIKTWVNSDISFTNFNLQFLYSLKICMLHYNPRNVSSINITIFRRTNLIITASGIITLRKRLYSMPDERRLQNSLLSSGIL
jgi:hypothetical protein